MHAASVPYTDRLGEDASSAWLVSLAVLHVLWIVGAILWARRASRVRVAKIEEGGTTVSGRVEADDVVLVGEPFQLRLSTGAGMWVEPQPGAIVRTATVRSWERRGRLQPGELLILEGELSREPLRTDDAYREAELRWVLRATRISGLAEGEVSVRHGRRARIAFVLGMASSLVLAFLATEHVVLATSGVVTIGRASVHLEPHEGVVATGQSGHRRIATTERTVEVRLTIDGEPVVLVDHLTEVGAREAQARGALPVIHARLAGVSFAQIGERPGLWALAAYGFVGLIAMVASWIFWTWDRDKTW